LNSVELGLHLSAYTALWYTQ